MSGSQPFSAHIIYVTKAIYLAVTASQNLYRKIACEE